MEISPHSQISTIDHAVLSEILNTSFSDDSYMHSTNVSANSCAAAVCNSTNLEISGISSIASPTRPISPTLSNHDESGLSQLDVAAGSENCSLPSKDSQLTVSIHYTYPCLCCHLP